MTPSPSARPLFLLASFLAAVLAFFQPTPAYACTGTVTVSPSGTGTAPFPPSGPAPGTSLDVTGSDFATGPVTVHWGSAEGTVLGKAVADRSGDFTLQVVVPEEPGDRPRIVARSARGGSNGMPRMGWADLGTGAPQTAVAAPAAPADEPASPQVSGLGVMAAGLVLLAGAGGLAVLVGWRRRRTAGDRAAAGSGSLDDLGRELADMVAAEDRSTSVRVGR